MKVGVASLSDGGWGGAEELWGAAARRIVDDDGGVVAVIGSEAARSDAADSLRQRGATVAGRPALLRTWRTNEIMGLDGFAGRTAIAVGKTVGPYRLLVRSSPSVVLVNQTAFHLDGHRELRSILRTGTIPYVLLTHMTWDMPLTDKQRLAAQQDHLGAAQNLFVSGSSLHALERQLAMDIPNASVVRNPINPTTCSVAPRRANEPLQLAIVARLDAYQKGHDLLLEAISGLAQVVQLNIYGAGPDRQYLERLAGYLGCRNVVFHGNVSDMGTVWSNNDALILPSRYEGLPLAMVEAMVSGRPVMISTSVPHDGLVVHGRNGFVVPTTIAGVRNGLLELMAKRAQLPSMGEAASRDALAFIGPDPGTVLKDILGEVSTR